MTSTLEPLTWIRIDAGYYRSGVKYTICQDRRPGVHFWRLRFCGKPVGPSFDTMREAKRAAEAHRSEMVK